MAYGVVWNLKRKVKHFRKLMKTNPKVAIAVACVPLVIAAILITITLIGEDRDAKYRVDYLWFYDLNTKTTFQVDIGTYPPIAAPSGKPFDGEPAGVQAYVYGCGGCDDTFVGYLEKLDDKAKQIMNESSKHSSDVLGAARKMGTLIRKPLRQLLNLCGIRSCCEKSETHPQFTPSLLRVSILSSNTSGRE